MKRKLLLVTIAVITPLMLFAWGEDVNVNNVASQHQLAGDIDVAFNGWTYVAYTFDSGITIRETRDHGNTWTTVDSYYYAGSTYPQVRIAVAGTDTNNLRLYVASVNQKPSVPTYTVFIDQYNATTHAFIHEYQEVSATKIYNIDVATDYKYPAVAASPYSVDIVFTKTTVSKDSLISLVSLDGGTTYTNRQAIANSSAYYRNVSIAYGRSASASNGRYFVAWDEYATSTAPYGHIYTSRNVSNVNDPFIPQVNIDSLDVGTLGYVSNPSIAVSVTAADNDSSGPTAVILLERAFNGNTSDLDILGFHNNRAHYTSYWSRLDVDNTTNNCKQPCIAFDSVYNNFLVTYFDTNAHVLPYVVNNWNLANPSTWGVVRNNYADDSASLVAPWPRLEIDPTFTMASFTWSHPVAGNSLQLFDGEYRTPRPVITSLSPNNAYAGDPGFTLTVNGYDFVNNSTIIWDATALTTTYVSSTQLTGPVTAAMIANYGNIPVTVVNPTTLGGGTSNADTFHILFNLAVNSLTGTYNTVSLFPNPASDHIDISYSFTTKDMLEIVLYDMTGKAVSTLLPANTVSGNNTIRVNIADLPQGIYEAVIRNGAKTSASKIVVNH